MDKGKLGFLAIFVFNFFLASFEVAFFSSAFWRLEIVSAIARRDTRLEEYPK